MENAVERKGLRVNVDKTKSMQLLFGKKSTVSKVDLFGVCGERVGCNSIQCAKCQRWGFIVVALMYLGRRIYLVWDVFVCRTCLGQ